jgi:DNA-binding transcriptional MerR regulator
MERETLLIGDVAEKAGVSVDTIRYYERLRLLQPAHRTASGYRKFYPTAIDRIKFIRDAKELGFSLSQIKELMLSGGAEECEKVRRLLEIKIADLDEHIRKMKAFRKTLAIHYKHCCEELEAKGRDAKCPVLFEPANRAANF